MVAIANDLNLRMCVYRAPNKLTQCQFTKTPSSHALQLRVNKVDFVCDSQYFHTNLSRLVEYLHFVQRCIDYPFVSVDDALATFAAAEVVVETL